VRQHVPWTIEHRAGVHQRVEVENIVVESGRRPHVLLHSFGRIRVPRVDRRAALLKQVDQAALASI
jgi:hypothetical protein